MPHAPADGAVVTGERSIARSLALVTVAVVFFALVLRSPIVAVAPVVDVISRDLGLTPAIAGLLTSIPVLCFALAAPLGSWLSHRGGTSFAVMLCGLGVALGCVVRSVDGTTGLLAGTVILGVATAIGNIVLPVVIRREYDGRRAKLMTGVYTSVINVGSMTVTLTASPIASAVGWRIAIGVWGAFAIAGVLVVVLLRGARATFVPRRVERVPGVVPPRVFRSGAVWLLTVAFAGQAFAYYAMTAWLPTLLRDEEGYSASVSGAISSIFQICAILGALLVPVIAARASDVAAIVVVGVLWVITPLGFLVAPSLWAVWCVLGGVAQGGGFTAVFILIVGMSRTDRHAAGISGVVQGFAYAVAATGPTIVGGLNQSTDGWTVPLGVIAVAAAAYLVAGVPAAFIVRRSAQRIPGPAEPVPSTE